MAEVLTRNLFAAKPAMPPVADTIVHEAFCVGEKLKAGTLKPVLSTVQRLIKKGSCGVAAIDSVPPPLRRSQPPGCPGGISASSSCQL